MRKLFCLLYLLSFSAFAADYDSVSSLQGGSGSSSLNWNHSASCAADPYLVVALLYGDNDSDIGSVTAGENPMTLLATAPAVLSGTHNISVYGIGGVSGTVAISASMTSAEVWAYSVLMCDVDQSSPVRGVDVAIGSGAGDATDNTTPISATVSSDAGDLVLSFATRNSSSGGMTSDGTAVASDTDSDFKGVARYAGASPSVTSTWSTEAPALALTHMLLISFQSAGEGGGGDPEPVIPTKLIFGSQPGNITVGQTFGAFTVRAVDDDDQLDTSFDDDVTIVLQTGEGSLFGTLTQAASGGIATFSGVGTNTLQTDAVIRATADGLTAADSDEFDVTAGGGGGAAGFPSSSRLGGLLQ